MLLKWTFLLVISVLPVLGRRTSRKDPLFDKLDERKINFKFKLYKMLEEGKTRRGLRIGKDVTKEISFDECARALSTRISKRKEELKDLSSIVEHVWSSFNTYRISSLKVKGTIKSPTRSVVQSLNPNSGTSPVVALTRMNMDLLNVTLGWGTKFSNLLLKSAKQTIKSNIQFMNMTVKKVKFDKLSKHLNINYVATDRLFHSTLKKKGDQVLTHQMTVENVFCRTATTRLLNRKEIQDYVLLRPGQNVMTGAITFANISSQNVYVRDTINDVAIKDMVLATTLQVIWGQKTFGSLTAKSIQAIYTNGIQNLSSEIERTVLIRNKKVDFASTLSITGDLHVTFLDDLNISAMFSTMVKKNQRGDIRGIKTFKSLEIWGNVQVDGEMNGVSLTNIMTVDTNQRVVGNITFSSIDVYKDVLTDSLNGHNLSSEAVVKSSFDLELKGVKTFDNDLNVSNITMDEESRIDFFDPSAEFGEFFDVEDVANARSIRWWVIKTPVTIRNIAANSIEVLQSSLLYLKELDNVWLKTKEQNITSLNAEKVKFQNLHVSKLNGINIADFVTVSGQDYIDAPITFAEVIFTRALDMEEKAYLNMPPEFWNPDVQVKIEGSIYMENATVEGHLYTAGAINNFNFMHAKENQTVEGEYHVDTIHLKDLTLPEVEFQYLNGIDVQKYFESSVLLFNVSNIYNKRFSTFKALELNCGGTLNNVMIDKIATTNANQILKSSYSFLDGVSFDKGVKVDKFFGDIGLENVVYVDMKGKVSNKYFNGAVIASDVRANGTVQGVNVTSLHLAAFNKSGNNYVQEKFTFWGNFEANEINIGENKSVDGVTLDDLIRLDESMELRDFDAFSVAAKNVRLINGKINGCDLQSVSGDALWLEQGSQSIPSRVRVNYLTIEGNLEMEYCNGAYTSDLINSLQTASPSENENVIFGNLKTKNLHIAGTVNDIGIGSIFQDCVQKSIPQILRGKKSFKRIKAKAIIADSMQSNKTCGIDVSEMYKLSINKSNAMYSYLENLILPELNATSVTVKDKMNGLRLPEDVVLTHSNERIEDQVTLDILNASAGLKVSGALDGIDLEHFIDRRITLDGSENIASQIAFQNDFVIEGDSSIKTINGISFDNIVNGVQKQVITGRKMFAEDLMVMLDFKVKGMVDDIDIQNLLRSIVRTSANESFKDVVYFSKIIMPSLVGVTINGFNIGDVYDDTHLLYQYNSDKIDNFTSAFQSHRKWMSKLDPIENSVLLYKWFELHRILDYGTIEKFLPVYEYGTHGPKYELETVQMVMWVKGGKRRGTKSIIADIMKDGSMVKTKQIEGKVFPLFCSAAAGFFIQETDAMRCTGEDCDIVVTLYISGTWQNTTIPSSNSGAIRDVQLFEVEEMIFLIMSFSNAGSYEKITVYQYEKDDSTWVLHQTFHLQDMTSFSILEVELDETALFHVPSLYLAVTGDEQNPGVTIYEWDEEFIPVSNLSTSVSTYATWVYNERALHLLLAKEKNVVRKENDVSVDGFNEPLEVYTMEDELLFTQTVNVKGVSFLETFAFREETFVLATSKHFGTVYVLQFRGYNGLELVQEIPSPGVTETRVFTAGSHLYLALNSVNSRGSPPSRILRASARGRVQEETAGKKDPIKLFV